MKKVGRLFLAFILTFALAIPTSLQWSNTVSAAQIKEVEAHGELFKNDHKSKSWKSNGSDVRLDLWFDIAGDLDLDKFKATIKLQKKDNSGKFKDTNLIYKGVKPKGKDVKQKFEFRGLEKGQIYRIYIDGYDHSYWINNRVSYELHTISTPTNEYELTPHYSFNRDGNDVLKFTINKTKTNQDHNLQFDGKVKYTIKPDVGESVSQDAIDISSKDDERKIPISKFTDDHLPAKKEANDSNTPKTKISVTYVGKIDKLDKDAVKYKITKDFTISQYKKTVKIDTKQAGDKLNVSSKVNLGDGVKDRKWTIELLKKKDDGTAGSPLKTKKPNDQNQSAKTFFEHTDFGGDKKAIVKATYSGKMYSNYPANDRKRAPRHISLYTASKTKNVDAPPKPQDNSGNIGGNNNGGSNNGGGNNNGGNNNGGNNNGGNKGGKNEEKVNEDATIDIKSKILEDDKVEIKATLKKVDDPKGTWKLKFNDGETKTYEEEKGSITKTFSTKNIEKDKVKFTAKFTGKDSKGKINVTKTEEIKVKEEKDDDQGDASGNNQDDDQGDASGNNKDDNQGDASGNNQDDDQGDASGNNKQDPPAKENKDAKITLTPTILENDQVEIKASLENAEEPNGTWTLTFNEGDPKTFENQGASITETYSTKDIKETKVPVTAKFVGKDKENKTIEQEITEQVTVKKEITPPPVVDATGDDGGTTTDNDDEVVGQVVTPPNSPSGQIGGQLPKTATHYSTGLIAGILFFISGAFVLLWRRRTT